MIYNSKNENNEAREGEARNLVEKTTGKFELKIASREFEDEEEKQPPRLSRTYRLHTPTSICPVSYPATTFAFSLFCQL
jgi:hypothetical protein